MIISITNLKGGVGKSTLTQNLAVCFAHADYNVCIVDTDIQAQVTTKWMAERTEEMPKIHIKTIKPEELAKNVLTFNKEFDVVLLDGTPALFELSTRTLALSDVAIIPMIPSIADIWVFESYLKAYEEAKAQRANFGAALAGFVLLNQYAGNNLDKEVQGALEGYDISVLKARIANRVAYREAMTLGRGVVEYKDKKAKDEMTELFNEIINAIA
jgi:chromosome partitioning protein